MWWMQRMVFSCLWWRAEVSFCAGSRIRLALSPKLPSFWRKMEDPGRSLLGEESSIFRVNFFIQQIKYRESMTIETERAPTSP
jgi:hypothetical protein